jgi:hypothetical protein
MASLLPLRGVTGAAALVAAPVTVSESRSAAYSADR